MDDDAWRHEDAAISLKDLHAGICCVLGMFIFINEGVNQRLVGTREERRKKDKEAQQRWPLQNKATVVNE